MRTLVIRIPLNESDPVDIVKEVDTRQDGADFLVELLRREFSESYLTVESGDKVSS